MVAIEDVRVCLPQHGCTTYTPGAGQALRAAIAVGPGAIDAVLAVCLGALLAIAALGAVAALRPRRPPGVALALVVAAGLAAAVPSAAPALAGAAALVSDTCLGLGLVLLAGRLPTLQRRVLQIAGALRLAAAPVALAQMLAAAPLGSLPGDVLALLAGAAVAVAAAVLLVVRGPVGPLRWATLLPIAGWIAAGVRLGLPFPAAGWVDLLPAAGLLDLGVLAAAGGPVAAAPVGDRVRRSVLVPAVALAAAGAVALAWPASAVADAPSGPTSWPLDAFAPTSAARVAVVDAENLSIRRCAAAHRVRADAADLLPAPRAWSSADALGSISAARAASTGFWVRLPDDPADEPYDPAVGGILAACVRSARDRFDPRDGEPTVVEDGIRASLDATDADERVPRATAAWSRCMLRHGIAARSPADVALGWGEGEGEPFPTPLDTREASADVACQHSSGFASLRAAALREQERRWAADHLAALQDEQQALAAEALDARRLLS